MAAVFVLMLLNSRSDIKSKVAKSEEVIADSSQQVTSAAHAGVEAYDTSYSSAAAYTPTASAYSYAAPSQSQWAAYSAYTAANPVRFHSGRTVHSIVLVHRDVAKACLLPVNFTIWKRPCHQLKF